MNLQKYRHVIAENYSGGNKRKLSVAIALIGGPSIILLDEPSAGMDPVSRRFMWGVINRLSTESKKSSILLTTHSMEEAEVLATKIAIIVEGKIVSIGTVQQLKEKYGKNFELDIKFALPEKDDFLRAKEQLGLENKLEILESMEECLMVLEKLEKQDLTSVVMNNGNGIRKQIAQNEGISLKDFLEFIFIQEKFQSLYKILKQELRLSIIESFRNYFSLCVDSQHKLSLIFEIMETNKERFEIQNYSLKQISLEQIFMRFAEDVVHQD